MHIGSTIKLWREARNYTQSYMATQLGISQVAYSKIESNQIKIDAERLIRIADILSVSMNDLAPDSPIMDGLRQPADQSTKISDRPVSADEKQLLMQIVNANSLAISLLMEKVEANMKQIMNQSQSLS
jgi:transcriptional regulator with XRE-family HTH domain